MRNEYAHLPEAPPCAWCLEPAYNVYTCAWDDQGCCGGDHDDAVYCSRSCLVAAHG